MKTQELFSVLEANKDKALMFEYSQNKWVGANYHITEVKHIAIDSVDCGTGVDAWNETVIQLWESPSELGKTKYMSAFKALGILKKVGSIKPFDLASELKFEYGNAQFHTAQLFVNDYEIANNQLIFKLAVEKTNCKAKDVCRVDTAPVLAETACCGEGSAGC